MVRAGQRQALSKAWPPAHYEDIRVVGYGQLAEAGMAAKKEAPI